MKKEALKIMKKIDLHIHTISTISDADFTFSLEKLAQYVNSCGINAIAITNHNVFNLEQYREIRKTVKVSKVFPGVEVNIGENNSFGHILLIADEKDADDFANRCKKLESKIKTPVDFVTVAEFQTIFGDLNRYLLIPHYDKEPKVSENIIKQLQQYIGCWEVASLKKFIYLKKSRHVSPGFFSDWRPTDEDEFPVRQTYIDIGSITLKSLKKTLADETKVQISEEEGHRLFQALPGLKISQGLTVIMGGRASGKTYTLNRLASEYDNVKYVRQFSLLEKEPDKAAESFGKLLERRNSLMIQDYLKPFAKIVSDIVRINLDENERKIDNYITSLIKYASETKRKDSFSKCQLFLETEYSLENLTPLYNLISAVETLLDSKEYKDIIDNVIERDKLIVLHRTLIAKHIEEEVLQKKKIWTNELVKKIKSRLQYRSATVRIEDVDFYDVQMEFEKVKRFEELVTVLKQEKVISQNDIEGFDVCFSRLPYSGAGELKKRSGKQTSFKNAYSNYNKPYDYLRSLMEIDEISAKDYYQFFVNIECRILNQYGTPVSGGERAEFNLLQEIHDALQYEMLLLDEPESSFDNMFLKEKVNHLIKEISSNMPVVVVTHNNTVGFSIKPDYIIYTKRVIENRSAKYEVYMGFPSDRELVSEEGKTIPNLQATLDCLEAGREAYEERKKEYEMLKD
jgi:ABC-type phosphate transport system ATPase subunit